MHEWNVELWREGEKERQLVFRDDQVTKLPDGTVVIKFPPKSPAVGITIATDDELRIAEKR